MGKNGIPPMLFKGKCPSKTNELPLAKCQNNSDDNGEVCCKSKNAKSPSLFDKKCKEKKVKKEKDVKPEPNGKQCCKAPGIAKPKIYNNCPPKMKAISMDKCDSKAPVTGKHAKNVEEEVEEEVKRKVENDDDTSLVSGDTDNNDYTPQPPPKQKSASLRRRKSSS